MVLFLRLFITFYIKSDIQAVGFDSMMPLKTGARGTYTPFSFGRYATGQQKLDYCALSQFGRSMARRYLFCCFCFIQRHTTTIHYIPLLLTYIAIYQEKSQSSATWNNVARTTVSLSFELTMHYI
ncbi:hypothetical protein AVEN_61565-1 [Araneus ventricosus]|uniref:Uncharacterized protein n=1 Tax=Araneus ventricosus TaxID=182803 RepID=A0A4Y2MJ29_ARAVE|nr:hypothetical protein AVEN_61565-1 [Araneus ventricosus]